MQGSSLDMAGGSAPVDWVDRIHHFKSGARPDQHTNTILTHGTPQVLGNNLQQLQNPNTHKMGIHDMLAAAANQTAPLHPEIFQQSHNPVKKYPWTESKTLSGHTPATSHMHKKDDETDGIISNTISGQSTRAMLNVPNIQDETFLR
jgi:hypothetical protein